jgi:hypothetical protein
MVFLSVILPGQRCKGACSSKVQGETNVEQGNMYLLSIIMCRNPNYLDNPPFIRLTLSYKFYFQPYPPRSSLMPVP